jgi:hypothetical protein
MPKAKTELSIPTKPPGQVPHLFGRGVRDRLLMMLAVHDRPLYIAELGKALNSDPMKIRKTVKVLVDLGVVVTACAGPLNVRYVGLNRGFAAYPWLLRLLRALESRYPQPRLSLPQRPSERRALRRLRMSDTKRSGNIDRLFYSVAHTRTLLTIVAMEETDAADIFSTVALVRNSVRNSFEYLQREGVIHSVIKGRRRVVSLDPGFPAARELRLFLRRLVTLNEEYAGYARLSMRNPESKRFGAVR